ncbi:MAG TPA: hypothetical protein QGH28_01450, partial [Chloroflexota bacterium]|nr:hypothetical protein [Chloroflexota bacterium]
MQHSLSRDRRRPPGPAGPSPPLMPGLRSFPGTTLLLAVLILPLLVGCGGNRPAGSIDFDYDVNWAAIGKRRILFKTDIDGDFDLYVADGFADELRRITDDPHYNKYADPSPDGARVVYSSNRDGGD